MYVYALRIQITKFKFYQYPELSVDSSNLMLPTVWYSEEITICVLHIYRLSIIISTIKNNTVMYFKYCISAMTNIYTDTLYY